MTSNCLSIDLCVASTGGYSYISKSFSIMPMNANDVMYLLATAVLQLKDTLHHWHSLACEM